MKNNQNKNKIYIKISENSNVEKNMIFDKETLKNLNTFRNTLPSIVKNMKININYLSKNVAKPMIEIANQLNKMMRPLVEIMISEIPKYTPYFEELAKTLKTAQENPDSLINWHNYSNKLSTFLWTIPYDIDSKKLKKIFEKVNSEKEFDDYMKKYFSNSKIESLFNSIDEILPKYHKSLFKQIKRAFNNQLYSLSNIGVMAIIDEICSFFLIDKGCNSRQDLLIPIIDDLAKNGEDNIDILNIMILSNNLNIIYENIEFNKKIKISTHKKVRRNPNQHGRSFSNYKIDTIMLLNSLYNLLIVRKQLKKYKDMLYRNRNNKEFYIPNKEEKKKICEKLKL